MDAFTFQIPVLETLLRASVVYLAVCVLMRIIPKRQAGTISPQDIVGAVIVGELAANGISGNNPGPLDILLMIGIVLFWNYALDWLSDHVPFIHRLVSEPPTRLIKDGRILWKALKSEMLNEEELLAQLRKQGVNDVSQVREAFLETDGNVSVIRMEDSEKLSETSSDGTST